VSSSGQDRTAKRDDQLDSWKEIASYLKRGVRTVQRWEREAGLPVRRLATEKRGAVYAYKSEIDAWREQRSSLLAADREETLPPGGIKRQFSSIKIGYALFALLVAAVSVLLLWPKSWRIAGAQRLTFEGNILTPAISPDGRSIVFASPRENADGNLDLWLRAPHDGAPSRLTTTNWHEFDPVFSPDSHRILYTVTESKPSATVELSGPVPPSTTSIYESDFSGHSRLIAPNANSARYSPDGHWIACLRAPRDASRPGASLDFGVLPVAGGGFSPIPLGLSAHDELLQASAPLWSPDGSHILLNARTIEAPEVGWWLVSVASRKAVRIDIRADGRDWRNGGSSGGKSCAAGMAARWNRAGQRVRFGCYRDLGCEA
jgi:hypothetical protein